MVKAGILFPRSGIFPLLGNDYLKGIKTMLSCSGQNEEIELIMEPVGFGADKKEIYQKAEQLLLIQEVDILVAFIDQLVADLIFPLAGAAQVPLIIVNPGANYAHNWAAQDHVIYLDLQDALLCRLTGKKAARVSPHQAAFAISYFDGGYHHGHAMATAYSSQGGNILFNYISPLRTADFTVEPLKVFLENQPEVTCILSLFSGEEANRFTAALNAINSRNSLQLFSSPQMLEEQTLQSMKDDPVSSLEGYVPWHSGIITTANDHFCSTFSRETKRPATVFSLLGWETGILLALFARTAPGEDRCPLFVQQLKENVVTSPRGSLILDEVSHHLIGPAYAMKWENSAKLQELEIITAEECRSEWQELMENSIIQESSGWLNTYLCY